MGLRNLSRDCSHLYALILMPYGGQDKYKNKGYFLLFQ